MSKEKGPLRVNAERQAAARTPPIVKPEVPVEVVRKYTSSVPLRRPAVRLPRRKETLRIDPSLVDQGLDAVHRAETTDLRADGCMLTVRIVPSVRDAIQQSGLSADEVSRFLDRLAKALGGVEAIGRLPEVETMPGLRLHQTVVGRKGWATMFQFVLALSPDTSAVIILACFIDRLRAD